MLLTTACPHALLQSLKVVFVAKAPSIGKFLAYSCFKVEEKPSYGSLTGTWVSLQPTLWLQALWLHRTGWDQAWKGLQDTETIGLTYLTEVTVYVSADSNGWGARDVRVGHTQRLFHRTLLVSSTATIVDRAAALTERLSCCFPHLAGNTRRTLNPVTRI